MGSVVDSFNYKPLSNVYVVLQETSPNRLVRNTVTRENGSFAFDVLAKKQYRLTLSYLGYRTKTIYIPEGRTATFNLGTMEMSAAPTQLKEVKVIAQKPLIEVDLDKTIYNVDADPENNTLSTLDMLRKVPQLSIDVDDNLLLNGNDNYQVLINGQPSSLFVFSPSDVFRSMPASMIQRVEVIANPSARYEARGAGGILNIVTYQKTLNGYNGSLNMDLSHPKGVLFGGYFSAKVGKLGFGANAGGQHRSNPTANRTYFRNDFMRQNQLEQTGTNTSANRTQYLSGEVAFDATTQNQFRVNYSLGRGRGTNSSFQQARLFHDEELTQAYQNVNNGRNASFSHDVTLSYQRSFKHHEAQLLSVAYKVSNSTNNSQTGFAVLPLLNYKSRFSTTDNDDRTEEQAFQIDYVQPFGKQLLEVGLKSLFQRNSSDYFYQNQDSLTGAYIQDPALSNNFYYQQDIHAAYTALSLRKSSWGLKTGMRLEQTKVDAHFESVNTLARQNYINLTPSISLSRILKKSGTLSLFYTQRIERPGLGFLNPYVDLTDPQNISYGNPRLNSTISHTINLAYGTLVKNNSLNVAVFHQFTNGAIQQITTLGIDSVTHTTYANLGQDRTYGFTLSGNATVFKKLRLNLNGNANYVKLTSFLDGQAQSNAGYTYNVASNASYRFEKGWRASSNLNYNSRRVLLQGKTDGYLWNSLSLNKEFLKNKKARISLSINSPFQKQRQTTSELITPEFQQRQEAEVIIRRYNVGFNYRFGRF